MVTLKEVFKDFEVIIKGRGQHSKYEQLFKLEPKRDPHIITLDDLRTHIESLQQRYPDRNFKLMKRRKYWVVTRKSYYIDEFGKRRFVTDRAPIYFDLEEQRFFVPKSYLKRRPKLVNYICMRTLGSLGVAQSKYMRMIRRVV